MNMKQHSRRQLLSNVNDRKIKAWFLSANEREREREGGGER